MTTGFVPRDQRLRKAHSNVGVALISKDKLPHFHTFALNVQETNVCKTC